MKLTALDQRKRLARQMWAECCAPMLESLGLSVPAGNQRFEELLDIRPPADLDLAPYMHAMLEVVKDELSERRTG